jgi:hypothetical protein
MGVEPMPQVIVLRRCWTASGDTAQAADGAFEPYVPYSDGIRRSHPDPIENSGKVALRLRRDLKPICHARLRNRQRTGGNIEKSLIRCRILQNCFCLAFYRKHNDSLVLLQLLHEEARITAESRHRMNVFWMSIIGKSSAAREAPFMVPL